MLALVLEADRRSVMQVPEPTRAAGDALVAVRLAGVCDTDLQLAHGYMGFCGIPGHEFVGTVLESDDRSWIGRRVVADINAGCGACADCVQRDGHHCASRTVLGIAGRPGAFAQRLTVPERCLVHVPDGVPDDLAVFAEPLAAALHVLDAARRIGAGERVVVLGDGKLGQLIALALHGADQRVVLVGRHEAKLARARAAGVEVCLAQDAPATLAGSALVVDATGSTSGLTLALQLVRPRGVIVLKTTVAGGHEVDLSPLVIHEIELLGSRCGDMKTALRALEQQRLDPRSMVEARYPLSRADQALVHAGRKGAMKVLIEVPA